MKHLKIIIPVAVIIVGFVIFVTVGNLQKEKKIISALDFTVYEPSYLPQSCTDEYSDKCEVVFIPKLDQTVKSVTYSIRKMKNNSVVEIYSDITELKYLSELSGLLGPNDYCDPSTVLNIYPTNGNYDRPPGYTAEKQKCSHEGKTSAGTDVYGYSDDVYHYWYTDNAGTLIIIRKEIFSQDRSISVHTPEILNILNSLNAVEQ